MDALEGTTVVWIAPAHSAEHERALADWARARGIRLREPSEARSPDVAVDMAIADEVELRLDAAREALAQDEVTRAETALAEAETLLRAHPELPNGAWLLAESYRIMSVRWRRFSPQDAARAGHAWAQAKALDGGRLPGVGEADEEASLGPTVPLLVDGIAPGWRATLDGRPLPAEAPPGDHQLLVWEGDHLRHATWVKLPLVAGQQVRVPGPKPCSTADLSRARVERGRVIGDGVGCGAWIAVGAPSATSSGDTALLVATCEKESCGPLVEWQKNKIAEAASPTPAEPSRRWPAWVTGTAFVAGIVIASTIALAASGAFDRPPPETRFVSGGIKVQ